MLLKYRTSGTNTSNSQLLLQVIAHTNCVMINLAAAGLLPLMAAKPELEQELTALMQVIEL
jgi:hypothetical protein